MNDTFSQSGSPDSPSEPLRPIRTIPAILSPFTAIWRELRSIFAVPLAFFGGLIGSIVLSAGLVAFFVYGSSWAIAAEEEEYELLEFEPGALVRIGKKPDENTPEKEVVQETRTEEQAVKETVTKEEKPPVEEKPKKKEEKPKSKEKPDPKRNKKAPVKEHNQDKNTPYDDLPTVDRLTGDPFGDPNGWAKLKKDGDPWATSVMAALNGMKVPSYQARGFKGQYRFELVVCKDGRVGKVLTKGSSGDRGLDTAVQGELHKLRLPKPPKKIADKMKNPCVKLKYRFVWGGDGRVR